MPISTRASAPPCSKTMSEPKDPIHAKLDRIIRTGQILFDVVDEMAERQVRTETRLVRLLLEHGLDANGQPVQQ